jgi:hypothetical protein
MPRVHKRKSRAEDLYDGAAKGRKRKISNLCSRFVLRKVMPKRYDWFIVPWTLILALFRPPLSRLMATSATLL